MELYPRWEIKCCHTQEVCLCSPNHYLPFSSQQETTWDSRSTHFLHMTFFGSVSYWSFTVFHCVILLKCLPILLLMGICYLEFFVLWLMLPWREPYYGPICTYTSIAIYYRTTAHTTARESMYLSHCTVECLTVLQSVCKLHSSQHRLADLLLFVVTNTWCCVFLVLAVLVSVDRYCTVASICIFLVIYEVEYFFIGFEQFGYIFFVTWMSLSWVLCLFLISGSFL